MEAVREIQEGGVCVELFRDSELTLEGVRKENERIQLICQEEIADKNEKNEEPKKRYQELGLNGQVALLEEDVKTIKKQAQEMARITPEKVGFQKITPAEMNIWKAFLPTEYKGEGVSKYSFDRIPQAVLLEWESAKFFRLFQCFSIRTPEGKSILKRIEERLQDPILIGWFEERPYLISRWAESLKSFNEIKVSVWLRRIFEPAATTFLISIGFVIGICLVYFQHLNSTWFSLLYLGCWLCLMPYLTDDIFLAIWRELHIFLNSKAFTGTWKQDLLTGCFLFSFLGGAIISIVSVIHGASIVFSNFTLIGFVHWIISAIIALAVIAFIRKRKLSMNQIY